MLTMCSSRLITVTLRLVITRTAIGYPKSITRQEDRSSYMMLVKEMPNPRLKPFWAIRPRSSISWSGISVESVLSGNTGLYPLPSESSDSINTK